MFTIQVQFLMFNIPGDFLLLLPLKYSSTMKGREEIATEPTTNIWWLHFQGLVFLLYIYITINLYNDFIVNSRIINTNFASHVSVSPIFTVISIWADKNIE